MVGGRWIELDDRWSIILFYKWGLKMKSKKFLK